MLVRIFTGRSWAGSSQLGDFEFDQLPAVGHKLVIAAQGGWQCGTVQDVTHRVTQPSTAADVALLVGPLSISQDASEPLPLALLDGKDGVRSVPSPTVPRTKPWSA